MANAIWFFGTTNKHAAQIPQANIGEKVTHGDSKITLENIGGKYATEYTVPPEHKDLLNPENLTLCPYSTKSKE